MPHFFAFFLTNIGFTARTSIFSVNALREASGANRCALPIGDEVFFEIVGLGFQYRAAAHQIMALAGAPLMLA